MRRARSLPGATPFFYVTFKVAANLPVSDLTKAAVSLVPSDLLTAAFYFELDDVTPGLGTVVLSRCGPVTESDLSAVIPSSLCTVNGTVLSTNDTYLLQFYYVPSGSTTPTPTPTPSPTPTATPTSTAAPTVVEESTGISSSQAQPLGITSDSGSLWVSAYQYGAIVGVPTSGAPTVYPLGAVGNTIRPAGMATGSDGNVYFASQLPSDPTIDQFVVGPGGSSSTIFTIPNQGMPFSIASGPDGNLWFTEEVNGAATIAAVSTTGDFSVFTPKTLSSVTTTLPLGVGITSGPDGALWFTETSAGRIGRITTAGALTEYATGISAGAQPYGIATGADGALWFAESGTSKIGRITVAGQVSEFTIPTASSAPIGIAAGADNALWFTESSGNKIGRITTAGAFSEIAIPTASSQPWGIALGPDGHLWFTERAANKVGTVR
ncbi:MAG TPA: hypothetical protein VFB22_05310 [Candidatus Baltobacteraceae bacterium]|nr:hypothetical protein [Candidatus Baltobacteraceae bacterium]